MAYKENCQTRFIGGWHKSSEGIVFHFNNERRLEALTLVRITAGPAARTNRRFAGKTWLDDQRARRNPTHRSRNERLPDL
jgi:hypothetical protein